MGGGIDSKRRVAWIINYSLAPDGDTPFSVQHLPAGKPMLDLSVNLSGTCPTKRCPLPLKADRLSPLACDLIPLSQRLDLGRGSL